MSYALMRMYIYGPHKGGLLDLEYRPQGPVEMYL